MTIPPNGQIACYATQPPFNAVPTFQGTLTLQSSIPFSVMSLRIDLNERGEFLMSTVPSTNDLLRSNDLVNLEVPPIQTIPLFQDGGGCTTTIILTNPGDATITGKIGTYCPGGSAGRIRTGKSDFRNAERHEKLYIQLRHTTA